MTSSSFLLPTHNEISSVHYLYTSCSWYIFRTDSCLVWCNTISMRSIVLIGKLGNPLLLVT